MNPFTIFFPFVLYFSGVTVLIFILAPFVMIGGGVLALVFFTDWSSKNKTVEYKHILGMNRQQMTTLLTGLCSIFVLACYTMFFLSCSGPWLRAKPTKDWKNQIKKIDTAIVLGFGIERDDKGNLLAGRANRFLLDWTLKNTTARTLLVQEGIWLAANGKATAGQIPRTLEIIRIHAHSEKKYINTLQAAYFALKKMSELGKAQAVLVTHDLQLQRAYWDLVKVRKKRPEWQKIEIIIPHIPRTPFPENSSQWHTRGGWRYKFVELFCSRPRDYLASTKSFR